MMALSARAFRTALLAASALILAGTASAQEPGRSPGFLDNIFGGSSAAQPAARPAQANEADLAVRLDRLEAHIRQLTGAIEQLQFRNQQLEQQLQRTQGNPGAGPGLASGVNPPPRTSPQASPLPPNPPPVIPSSPGRRSDVFDPTQNPNAPGAPQTLGSVPATAVPPPAVQAPIGVPGGRAAGAPLDLSTLSGVASADPSLPEQGLPPPPPRNPNATGAQVAAVAPPSQTPRDEFDLAYGYVQRKDYALAEESLRGFLKKYPSDGRAADAQYWLGESLYQRQRYRDAAESFLTVTTKHDRNPKAPEALLRLGQSLAALGEKETACAAWGEIGRKYANASAGVQKNVAAEQKRVRC
jgi:tol-pal system protein YbgF